MLHYYESMARPHDARQPPPMGAVVGAGLWILTIVLSWHDPLYGLSLIAGFFLIISCHEAGHWLAARFVRVQSDDLATTIGVGPGVSIFSGRLRLGMLPGSGRVQVASDWSLRRSQTVAIAAGGPIASVIGGLVFVVISQEFFDVRQLTGPGPAMNITGWFSILLGVGNLIPFSWRPFFPSTDGYQILQTLRRSG